MDIHIEIVYLFVKFMDLLLLEVHIPPELLLLSLDVLNVLVIVRNRLRQRCDLQLVLLMRTRRRHLLALVLKIDDMILGLNELLLVFMLPADIDRQLLFELFDLCLIFYIDGRLGNNWSTEDRYFLIEAFDF